ncbi:MAG: 2,3-bisphosphoglycerate-independent phosphoglycerate mutase [Thermoanaerobaculales bacterium]|jgi:2,3-bisphosphoglycerate-independent phosphoglycerate mutase|nr:2,3-bisphosphoglycerate-independent phosphoglycerate mutase [Thermoanaerobaculales bacterium]
MKNFKLNRNRNFEGIPGPLVLVIMDGVGLYRGRQDGYVGNAVDLANMPNFDSMMSSAPVRMRLRAHGPAVGLPGEGDMGNSEVGHNAMGAGRIFAQGAKLVSDAIAGGGLFQGAVWRRLVGEARQPGSTYHLIGLVSDGNVHSHIDHLEAMVRRLAKEGVPRIRLHALADGRDVDPVTFHVYLRRLENLFGELREDGCDVAVASGGGRMAITMDRYNANWEMVRRGWETHVLARGRIFSSALEAVETLRGEHPGVIDQDLPPFVIGDTDGHPIGEIVDGDVVVFFNFRGDRAIEISRAFIEDDFDEFDRGRVPEVSYAGMMEYDGDLKIPPAYLVEPPAIASTVSEYLVHNGVAQLAVAETQKFGHVTYFWNGNNSEPFDRGLEDWVEITSDVIPFERAPAMKAKEVCGEVEKGIGSGKYGFIRVNFANGDMVGHTGVLEAAVTALEVVDDCLGRLEAAVAQAGGTLIVTADHGNSDMMLEVDTKNGTLKRDENGAPVIKTSHSLSPVPWLLMGAEAERFVANPEVAEPGLGNLASTLLLLLGFEPPADYLPALIAPRP